MSKIFLAQLLNALRAQEQRRTMRQKKFEEGAIQTKMQVQEGYKDKNKKNIKEPIATIEELKIFLLVNTIRK